MAVTVVVRQVPTKRGLLVSFSGESMASGIEAQGCEIRPMNILVKQTGEMEQYMWN
jgi:hypothetical protein